MPRVGSALTGRTAHPHSPAQRKRRRQGSRRPQQAGGQHSLTLAAVTQVMQACVPSTLRTRPQAANMGLHTTAVRQVPTMTILQGR